MNSRLERRERCSDVGGWPAPAHSPARRYEMRSASFNVPPPRAQSTDAFIRSFHEREAPGTPRSGASHLARYPLHTFGGAKPTGRNTGAGLTRAARQAGKRNQTVRRKVNRLVGQCVFGGLVSDVRSRVVEARRNGRDGNIRLGQPRRCRRHHESESGRHRCAPPERRTGQLPPHGLVRGRPHNFQVRCGRE